MKTIIFVASASEIIARIAINFVILIVLVIMETQEDFWLLNMLLLANAHIMKMAN